MIEDHSFSWLLVKVKFASGSVTRRVWSWSRWASAHLVGFWLSSNKHQVQMADDISCRSPSVIRKHNRRRWISDVKYTETRHSVTSTTCMQSSNGSWLIPTNHYIALIFGWQQWQFIDLNVTLFCRTAVRQTQWVQLQVRNLRDSVIVLTSAQIHSRGAWRYAWRVISASLSSTDMFFDGSTNRLH